MYSYLLKYRRRSGGFYLGGIWVGADFVCDFFVAVFWRGFCEIWAVNVVFWWTGRGELYGKDGLLVGGFWGLWILQFFGIYFWARVAPLPLGYAGFFPFGFAQGQNNKQQQQQRQELAGKRITFPLIAMRPR
jgi:hypothetical protein